MASPTMTHIVCSLLMSTLFAYSASVQFDDIDWYFWIPLYSCACIVNLLNWVVSSNIIINIAKADLCLGLFLFIKVVFEDIKNRIFGFWSLDLSERVVREKIGSGLVVISMVLNLIALRYPKVSKNKDRDYYKFQRYVQYGMVFLVGFSYGLPFVFFAVQKGELKFDRVGNQR